MHVRTDIWNQFGDNPAGSGFRAVQTSGSMRIEWQCALPTSPGTSSPVIGPNGTIYIGTVNGWLLAIDPEAGNLKWTVQIAAYHYVVQTPAVADDGIVYCLCTSTVTDHRTPDVRGVPSFVISVLPNGVIRWRTPTQALGDMEGTVNGHLFGAPRILSGPRGSARVIFVVRYELVVSYEQAGLSPESRGPLFVRVLAIVDENGTFLLSKRYEERILFVEAHGGGGLVTPAHIADPPPEVQPCADTPVVFGSLPAREPWTIITPGDKGLYQIRWDAQASTPVGVPKLFALPREAFPGPVAFPNGLLVGLARPDVIFIDTNTFTQYLPEATKLGERATVAGGLRHMYFVLHAGALFAVDSNGAVWHRFVLQGKSVAFPALSASHIHVVTTRVFRKFSLDLQWNASNNLLFRSPHSGLSSPAIGPSAEVYVVGGPDFATAPSLYRFTGER